MNIESLHQLFLECNTANTDTRTVSKNNMFFALKGDNFNGNKFAEQALQKGAKYAIVDEKEFANNKHCVLVDNVLETLQKLAAFHRTYLNLPIISLTGSNGKTTTKELIQVVLSKKFKTVATAGNLNNHIGVPLTLLSMDRTTEIGIVEMGANHLREIEFLCSIAQPNYGYITNFGKAHLEGFGSVEGVIKGKSELYDYLSSHNGLIFVNGDDTLQLQKTEHCNRYLFGGSKELNATITMESNNPFVTSIFNNLTINSNLIGTYNFNNISAAIAIGNYFEVLDTDIKDAIESYVPKNNRSQILNISGKKIILDAYNANPSSVEAAIKNLNSLSDKKKYIILGDMFELGNDASKEHQHIVDMLLELQFDNVVLIGENYSKTKVPNNYLQFKSFADFKSEMDKSLLENSTILIKGSRGMALERVVDLL